MEIDVCVDVDVTCAKCHASLEANDNGFQQIYVQPHVCKECVFQTGSLEHFIFTEAQYSGDPKLIKWLEMKQLEYELKNNIV